MYNKITHTSQLTICLATVFVMSLLSSHFNIATLRSIAWALIGIIYIINPTMPLWMQIKYGERSGKMIARFSGFIIILIGLGG